MRKFQAITLFPEMFTGVFESSMMWKAQKDEIVKLETINLRDFGLGPRRQVDDTPYGGGDGMLLMIEPLWRAVKFAKLCSSAASLVPKISLKNTTLPPQFAHASKSPPKLETAPKLATPLLCMVFIAAVMTASFAACESAPREAITELSHSKKSP